MSFIKKYNEELYHYGILGMKWGVHRGKTTKAYEKASKKLEKLDKKIDQKQQKANKNAVKADSKMRSSFSTRKSAAKAISKANKSQLDLTRAIGKADKWYKSMEKTFKDTDVSMSTYQAEKGKKYVELLTARSQLRYY